MMYLRIWRIYVRTYERTCITNLRPGRCSTKIHAYAHTQVPTYLSYSRVHTYIHLDSYTYIFSMCVHTHTRTWIRTYSCAFQHGRTANWNPFHILSSNQNPHKTFMHSRVWMHAAREAFWRRAVDPCTPLLFDLYHYFEQNGYFWLVLEHAPGPSSQVLPFLVAGFDTLLIPWSFSCVQCVGILSMCWQVSVDSAFNNPAYCNNPKSLMHANRVAKTHRIP